MSTVKIDFSKKIIYNEVVKKGRDNPVWRLTMELLEQRIRKDGVVYAKGGLKLDRFLSQCIDVEFVSQLGKEFYRLFKDCGVNKILTVESEGISVACLTAQAFSCPAVFAKKRAHKKEASETKWKSRVHSAAKNASFDVTVGKEFLGKGDRVLIVDDCLSNGNMMHALVDLCEQAGAELVGAGVVIEKAYHDGGSQIRRLGIRVEALARIISVSVEDGVNFC